MPAPSIFLDSADIVAVLGCSRRTAQNMINMFEQRGQTVRRGTSTRNQMVSIKHFADYLAAQDGENPIQRRNEIKECLKENALGHTRKDIKK